MLKRLLKMAAANVAFLILKRHIAIAAAVMAMGSVLTAAAAEGPNLVANGHFITVPGAHDQISQVAPWTVN